jgi:type IV secretory pathway VirB10-like protein
MSFSPFRVSFDGPLARGEQWRARFMAAVFGGAALLLGSGGFSVLLNASSGMLGAWTNATPAQEISTTGTGAPVEPPKPDIVFRPVPAQMEAAVQSQAAKPNLSPRDPRKPQPKARAQRRAQSQKARDEWRRARADAQIERRWNERAADIGRRSPGDDFFRPFR